MVGSTSVGQAGPSFEALAMAKAAGYTVFQLIDRVSIRFSFLYDNS